MKKRILFSITCALIIPLGAIAQEGKPSAKVFSNFNYDMSAEAGENAFKEFEHPNKKLTIVGPISSETGLENIELPQEVDFKGVLKGEDLTNEYLKATVFCLPTVEDGFGLVLGEALSFGIPLITTENSGGLDIIENNGEGYIVPIRDSSAIARKFQELADNPELLRKMRQSAREKSKKLGGWKDTGFNLSKILTDIANN